MWGPICEKAMAYVCKCLHVFVWCMSAARFVCACMRAVCVCDVCVGGGGGGV